MSIEENKALIRRHAEAWNANDPAVAVDELMAADIYSHSGDMHGGKGEVGREGWRDFLASQANEYPDRHYTIVDLIAEGDKVAAMLEYRFTDPGTGEQRVMFGTNVYGLRNGEITDFWGFWPSERTA